MKWIFEDKKGDGNVSDTFHSMLDRYGWGPPARVIPKAWHGREDNFSHLLTGRGRILFTEELCHSQLAVKCKIKTGLFGEMYAEIKELFQKSTTGSSPVVIH